MNVGKSSFQRKGHDSGPAGDGRQDIPQVRANGDLKLESGLNLHLGFKNSDCKWIGLSSSWRAFCRDLK